MLPLSDLFPSLGGELIAGSPETLIGGVASLAEAGEGEISFFGNPKYLAVLRRSRAAAVLVPRGYPPEAFGWQPDAGTPALVAVDNPSLEFAKLVKRFTPPAVADVPGVHPTAVLGENVRLGRDVCIRPYAVIEDGTEIADGVYVGAHVFIGAGSVVGAGSRIYPNVTIREHTRIGRRVIIHSGTVIGGDGFGFEQKDGRHVKIPQTGIVQIDDDVEIGSNVSVDRARFGRTHIGEGTKIDNLVQIAHNVVIGPHCLIVAQVGISGSTRLGRHVTLGGQVGVIGHIEIGDEAAVGAQSGVSKNVPPGALMWGTPTVPINEAKEQIALTRRLPKLIERVKKLEAELAELRGILPGGKDTSA